MKAGNIRNWGLALALALGTGFAEDSAAPSNPLPAPDLSVLEPEVAEQLGQARVQLQTLVDQGAAPQDLAQAYGELGKLYQAYELSAPAEAAYLRALELAPDSYDWTYYLAYLCQQQGKAEQARDYFTRAKALRPESPLEPVRLGDVLMALNQVPEAKREYLEALYLQPGATAILARLGEVALAEQRYELALSYLLPVVQQQPQADRLNYLAGMAYRGLGQQAEAKAYLAKSGPVGIEPPDPLVDDLQQLVRGERLYLLRGKLAYSAGQYEAAAEAFRQALAADHRSARASINLGTTLVRLGQTDEAISRFRQALELDPKNLTARFNLGQLLLGRDQAAEAVTLLEAVTKESPDDAEAHLSLAQAYERIGRIEGALAAYRQTARLDPAVEQAWIGGSQLLVEQGRNREALQVLEQAHEGLPSNGRIAHALARMLAGAPDPTLRDGARALPLALQVYQARPTPGHAQTLAMAYAEIGDCAEAAHWQEQAQDALLSAGPDFSGQAAAAGGILEHYRSRTPCRYPSPEP
jgi:tetratricopeptide (TPR) repeat protein